MKRYSLDECASRYFSGAAMPKLGNTNCHQLLPQLYRRTGTAFHWTVEGIEGFCSIYRPPSRGEDAVL